MIFCECIWSFQFTIHNSKLNRSLENLLRFVFKALPSTYICLIKGRSVWSGRLPVTPAICVIQTNFFDCDFSIINNRIRVWMECEKPWRKNFFLDATRLYPQLINCYYRLLRSDSYFFIALDRFRPFNRGFCRLLILFCLALRVLWEIYTELARILFGISKGVNAVWGRSLRSYFEAALMVIRSARLALFPLLSSVWFF